MDEELSSKAKQKCFMLLVERGERQWLLPIERNPIAIGRSQNNHVIAEDSQMAPRHLRIIPLGEEIWAKDMGSPAGFQVNGRWLREALLRSGDEIAIGELRASVLVEERAAPLEAPEPIELPEAPEPPPTPVRRRYHAPPPRKSGVPAWAVVMGALAILAITGGIWVQRASRQEAERLRQESLISLERARNYLREKQAGKARESLRGISQADPEILAQKAAIEKEIAAQEAELRKPSGREEGDEFYERYLFPLYNGNEILSDIRWENVAWRRSEEFLKRFPKHPYSSIVQSRRDRFAAGAKEAPPARIGEMEIDTRQLIQAKLPNFAMARAHAMAFIRDNMGSADDLQAREILKQIDAQSEEYLGKTMDEARKLWNAGERDKALAILDRLVLEIGREDLAERAREAKRKLE